MVLRGPEVTSQGWLEASFGAASAHFSAASAVLQLSFSLGAFLIVSTAHSPTHMILLCRGTECLDHTGALCLVAHMTAGEVTKDTFRRHQHVSVLPTTPNTCDD